MLAVPVPVPGQTSNVLELTDVIIYCVHVCCLIPHVFTVRANPITVMSVCSFNSYAKVPGARLTCPTEA